MSILTAGYYTHKDCGGELTVECTEFPLAYYACTLCKNIISSYSEVEVTAIPKSLDDVVWEQEKGL
mgnify:CR=1 FL=1